MANRIVFSIAVLSLLLWVGGACAEPPVSPPATSASSVPEEAAEAQPLPLVQLTPELLEARATAYLDAIKVNDWQGAYGMELGALDGSLTALSFMQGFASSGAKVLDYSITDVSVRGPTEGWVEAKIKSKMPQLFKPYTAPVAMVWVLRDGQLYRTRSQVEAPPRIPAELERLYKQQSNL